MKIETLIILIGIVILLLIITQKAFAKPEVIFPPKVKKPKIVSGGKLLLTEEITQA